MFQVVVIWAYSVSLVWVVWFVSKRFVNEIIMIIINHLKRLIIKWLDNQTQISVWLSNPLMINPRNPIMHHNQINQYPPKSLISFLPLGQTQNGVDPDAGSRHFHQYHFIITLLTLFLITGPPFHLSSWDSSVMVTLGKFVVYYESIKRDLKIRPT
jgi:hypothetical protein